MHYLINIKQNKFKLYFNIIYKIYIWDILQKSLIMIEFTIFKITIYYCV